MREFCQGIIFKVALLGVVILLYNNALASSPDKSLPTYWVKFTEKSFQSEIRIPEKTIARRISRGSNTDPSWFDAPVNEDYISRVIEAGCKIRHISRWLNAVSVEVDPLKIPAIANLPFVAEITKVSRYSRPRAIEGEARDVFAKPVSLYDYGASWNQIHLISVDSLHNLGLSGDGITIGVMDTGFDTSHTAFSHLRANNKIIATYDFINNDFDVVDLPNTQRTHGTQVLSALAGFQEGYLIGPAFNADIVLAKTEIVFQEVQAEEDNWIAAAEWMESLGVDIFSSSLGYTDWYDTTQLDGQTAAITIASNVATSLGVIVVNAAGNEGNTAWRKVIPPADGDSVIAVGAVDPFGDIADFSSRGPTADGRIKPDFCTQGVSVVLANWGGGYGTSGGTSFATPLMAGGIALLLEGHPGWRISDIFTSLKNASSQNYLPNNTYGWGIPDFTAAYYGESGPIAGQSPRILVVPQPAVGSARFFLTSDEPGTGDLSIHDLSGTPVIRIPVPIETQGTVSLVWYGNNDSENKVASGIYIAVFSIAGKDTMIKFFYVAG